MATNILGQPKKSPHSDQKKPVTTRDNQKSKIMGYRASGMTWSAIAQILDVKPGTLCRWAKNGWEPKDNAIRSKLGLPPKLVLYPPCKRCGQAHATKRCTHKPTFDEQASKYEAWKVRNQDKLSALVAWAEGK